MGATKKNTLLRQWTGPLTADLVREPGAFGLGQVPARLQPDATTTVVCGFCSTGCGLKVHLKNGEAINLSAAPEFPVNLGMACPKGWEALTPLEAPDRATIPLFRSSADDQFKSVSWTQALHEFVTRMKGIQARHGPHSIAFLSTGQICTEEMALLGALFKFGMGGLHCDSNTRQCMATSQVAYKQSFGFDAPPFAYTDFEESDCLVFIGANPCIAHPILWQRVLRNQRQPAIIVLDPRATETAMNATLHVPLAPKSDLILLYAVAHALLQRGAVNRSFIEKHTTGFEAFAQFLSAFPPERACAAGRLPLATFERLVELIATRERVSFWWTMGVNQSHEATRTAQAIINLALMTGNIGRPGTGPNSITGQCNAMGSRLFANVTSLPGGRDFKNSADRAFIAHELGLPLERVPPEPSWAYDQIIDGIDSGAIKGLWIVATNSAHSWISQRRINELLGKLDFLVVQDLYTTTDTAQRAHLLLPAAGWGEKDGTLINSERRIGLVKKVRRAPGEALSDFHIFKLIAAAWGCDNLFREWTSPEATFQILKRLSAGQPCDITGIVDYRHLDDAGGIQWPLPATPPSVAADVRRLTSPSSPTRGTALSQSLVTSATHEHGGEVPTSPQPSPPSEGGEGGGDPFTVHGVNAGARHVAATQKLESGRRLFEDGHFFTPDGRARFVFDEPQPVAEPTCSEFPFVLLTGRGSSAQWHTNTRTAKSAILRQLHPAECYVEIHPQDARRLRIRAGAKVRITSRRGSLEAAALLTSAVQRGQLFVPMHYQGVNQLTCPSFDPHSRQPSYKHCAVRISVQ